MTKLIKIFFHQKLMMLSLVLFSVSSLANDNWAQTSFNLKLTHLLDRDDGYCIDVVGSGNRIRFDMPLITHNCKGSQYADEAVIHRNDGTLYFPAYKACVTVMGLNNHALPYNGLMLKTCNVDQGFLKSTKFQKFSINKDQQFQLDNTNLCLTAGDLSKETYSDAHRWRSLYMQDCAIADKKLSQWHLVKG